MSASNNNSSSVSIVEWLISLGISNLLTSDDLLSGNTLHVIMKKTVAEYKNDLLIPASAINKISNWNNLMYYSLFKNLENNSINLTLRLLLKIKVK